MPDIIQRVPPSSQEAEQSVLGAMLLSESCVLEAVEKLREEDFYTAVHRRIWRAMAHLAAYNKPVDMVTVAERMGADGGGELGIDEITYLSSLTEAVPSLRNIGNYADIIREKSRLRRFITAAAEIADLSYKQEASSSEVLERATDLIYKIAGDENDNTLVHIREALLEAYESISRAAKSKEGLMGVSTGFPIMDKKLSGLQPSQLIVVAGRPGMGKTSFALNVAEHIALKANRPVAYFSLEMSREQLGSRLLCSHAQVDSQNARTGALKEKDFYALADAMVPLEAAPVYIDDSALITPSEIMAKIRRLKRQLGDMGLVIIDYLQLMTSGQRNENRQNEVSQMTRYLKVAAKELSVPVMLLSQLSRASEKRENKRPLLSDLRESGAIEQDADVVLFLHREDYYDESAPGGDASIIIAKQRSGPTGTIAIKWKGELTKYQELDFREEEK